MSERYNSGHTTTETNESVEIKILDSAFGGSATEISNIGAGWLQDNLQKLDPKNPLENPIQDRQVSATLWIETSEYDESALIDDLFGSVEGRFTMELYKGGSLEWKGVILPDLCSYQEKDVPYSVTLVAKGFSATLKGTSYTLTSLSENRASIISAVDDILGNLSYGININTQTSWIIEGGTSADDYWKQVFIDKYTFREYAESGDASDQTITLYEALEWVLKANGCVLRQVGGKFVITQITALTDPTDVKNTEYTAGSVGTNTETQIDLTNTATIVHGSNNNGNPGIKSASVTYQHRTKISDVKPPRVVNVSGNTESEYTQFIISDGGQEVKFTTNIYATVDDESISFGDSGFAVFEIQAGDYYWNGLEWTETESDFKETLNGPLQQDGLELFVGSVDILTDNIPADADGLLTLRFKQSEYVSGGVTSNFDDTSFQENTFEVINAIADENSTSIGYTYNQTANQSVRYDYGDIYFGDGPAIYSRGAFTLADGTRTGNVWARRDDAIPAYKGHAELLLRETIDLQRTWTRRLTATVKSSFNFDEVLSYDGQYFFALGGTFDGYTGVSQIEFLRINVQTGTDNFLNNPQFDSSVSGGQSLIDSAYVDVSSYAKNALTSLSRSIDGERFSLPVRAADNVQFFEGDKLIVVNIANAEKTRVTVSDDTGVGTSTIPIESATFDNYPEGSFVAPTGEYISTGIIAGERSVRIFSEVGVQGVTLNDLDGFYDSIQVELYESINQGRDFKIINKDTGDVYTVTSDSDLSEGEVTISFDLAQFIKAPAGSYVKWDEIQLNAYNLVSPGLVQSGVEQERTANSIGTIAVRIAPSIPLSSISLKEIDGSISVKDNDVITIENKRGFTETVVVSGDQTLTSPTDTLAIDTKVFSASYEADYAWVFEAGWKQSSRITQTEDSITLLVSDVDAAETSIAGLELQVGNFDPSTYGGNNLSNLIGEVNARSVLYASSVDVSGNAQLASINLATGTVGSVVKIVADDVYLNNWVFNSASGVMYTNGKSTLGSANSGVHIDGISGDFSFGDGTSFVKWDGTTLETSGKITSSSGSIGGWDLTASTIKSGTDLVLDSTSSAPKIYLNNKSSYTSSTRGIFIGFDGTSPVINIGGSSRFLKFKDGILNVNGALVTAPSSALDGQYIDALSIGTASIKDANITTAKITDANITTAKIADANITTAKIDNLAVTGAKIANATIAEAKISGTLTASVIDVNDLLAQTAEITGNISFGSDISASSTSVKISGGSAPSMTGQTTSDLYGFYSDSENYFGRVSQDSFGTSDSAFRFGTSTDYIQMTETGDIKANFPTTTPTISGVIYMVSDGSGNYNLKIKG